MEQVISVVNFRQFIRRIPRFSLPLPFMSIALLMVVGFLAAIVVVNALTRRFGEANLFKQLAPFSDLVPGQHVDLRQLETLGFQCWQVPVSSQSDLPERCSQNLPTGPVSRIDVNIWGEDIKTFCAHFDESLLATGDLTLLWGSPEVDTNVNWMLLSWPDHHITGIVKASSGRFTYFAPVLYICMY